MPRTPSSPGWISAYGSVLAASLRRKAVVIVVAAALVGGSVAVYRMLPRELVPIEDRGIAFGFVIAPEGSTLAYTDRYLRQIEEMLMPMPERDGMFTAVGLGFGGPGRVTSGLVFFRLKPQGRAREEPAIVQAAPRTFAVQVSMAFRHQPAEPRRAVQLEPRRHITRPAPTTSWRARCGP
ncbi:MAG: efflux RND transporter permease subunit [Acidobacteriota bacterium]